MNVFTRKQIKQKNKVMEACLLYSKSFCNYFDIVYHSNVKSCEFKTYCEILQMYLDKMDSAVWNDISKVLSKRNLYQWFLLQNKQSVFELFKDEEEALLYEKFIDLILKEDSPNVYFILKYLIIEHTTPQSILTYKGYFTVIEFEAEDKVLYGKIENANGDLVTFESDSAKEIEKEFHDAVDDWLEFRKEIDNEVESKN